MARGSRKVAATPGEAERSEALFECVMSAGGRVVPWRGGGGTRGGGGRAVEIDGPAGMRASVPAAAPPSSGQAPQPLWFVEGLPFPLGVPAYPEGTVLSFRDEARGGEPPVPRDQAAAFVTRVASVLRVGAAAAIRAIREAEFREAAERGTGEGEGDGEHGAEKYGEEDEEGEVPDDEEEEEEEEEEVGSRTTGHEEEDDEEEEEEGDVGRGEEEEEEEEEEDGDEGEDEDEEAEDGEEEDVAEDAECDDGAGEDDEEL